MLFEDVNREKLSKRRAELSDSFAAQETTREGQKRNFEVPAPSLASVSMARGMGC
jgi:hypothetical protein